MSTRKTLNKQNAESPVPGSQDRSSVTPKSNQDVGSESESSTPTSRDSCATPALDSKRKRRTNSTQSNAPTPKKASETTDLASAVETEDKNQTKASSEDKSEETTHIESPRTRKRRVFDKSAIVTRKSTSDLAKNSVRTLRGVPRKSYSPIEVDAGKRRSRKKPDVASTPVKRKREDSMQSEDKEEDELPVEKLIKIEKIDPEDEDEPDENIVTEIKIEKHEKHEEIKDDKEVIAELAEIKTEPENEDNNEEDNEQFEEKTPRKNRRKLAPTVKKTATKVIKKPNPLAVTPTRRGRPARAATAAVPIKVGRKPKKVPETKPTLKSPVPENVDIIKTEVPESIEIAMEITPTDAESPLTVDTTAIAVEKETTASTSSGGTEKAASLSPTDLVSEGVSESSVKQFYKKPEFMENNLGIEQDPKLGGIVQEVEKDSNKIVTDDDESPPILANAADDNSVLEVEIENEESDPNASDSIKEGELLILEDSTEEEITLSSSLKEEVDEDGPPILEKESLLEDEVGEIADEAPELKNATNRVVEIESEILTNETAVSKNTEILNNVCDLEIKTAVDDCKKENDDDEKEHDDDENENDGDEKENDDDEKENDDDEKEKVVVEESEEMKLVVETECEEVEEEVNTEEIAESPAEGKEEIVEDDAVKDDVDVKDEPETMDSTGTETAQMEVDSGVSDVAENNSSDPNEDLNVLPEIVEEKLRRESDEDGVVENKENIKENMENIQIVDVSSIKALPNEKADLIVSTATTTTTTGTIKKVHETPETLKEKENHLKTLGLLTLKAADEAKIEKQKRRELFQSTSSSAASTSSNRKINGNSSCVADQLAAGSSNGNKSSQEYTGTLKTVIKLNRPLAVGPNSMTDKQHQQQQQRKGNNGNGGLNTNGGNGNSSAAAGSACGGGGLRHPLKMTFQKGRGRGTHVDRSANQSIQSTEDTYYTIQNEGEAVLETTTQHGRKSHNRSHNTEPGSVTETVAPAEKKEEKETIVIPEKASSFSIHPGRLCQDQCFYCGGKFGLYDTPCHVAQLKSAERQKKILDNEEKLTVDNCLCDACFRHVDRRANAPSYKKRLSAPSAMDGEYNSSLANDAVEGENGASPIPPGHTLIRATCFVTNCKEPASHTFRRKGFRKTIRLLLGDDLDLSNYGGRLPICDKHYEVIIQCLECALCKRRLVKNHMYHITQEVQQLEELLMRQGIPVKLFSNPAVCKLCRYFTNLLVKPPEGKTQKAQFVKNYRRRLLHFHNIQSDDASDADEQVDNKDTSAAPTPAKRGRKPKKLASIETATKQQVPPSRKSSTCNESTPISSEENSNDVADVAAATSGQMLLDNDVMVDYDVPVLCDSPSPPVVVPPSKLQTILQVGNVTKSNDDISVVLRSNPNISMRELFPGEEEMGLNVNLPFGGSTSTRTPEGWTRIQTFLQYDEPTRRLWENLQKPYGNQSSFLRHLVLLEKFFRNGDLMLSQNASANAVVYSETVQNRLRSYDNSTSGNTAQTKTSNQRINSSANSSNNNLTNQNSRPTVSQILRQPEHMKKLNNLTITITPKPKQTAATATKIQNSSSTISSNVTMPKSSNSSSSGGGGVSILKSNLLGRKNSAVEIIPIGGGSSNESSSSSGNTFALTKQQKILAAASQLMSDDNTSTNTAGPSNSSSLLKPISLPPQLISINRGSGGSGSTSLLIGRGTSSGGPSNSNSSKFPMSGQQMQYSLSRPGTSKAGMPVTLIKLPSTLTHQERISSKNWRPTLMPINTGPLRSAPGVMYETADGRKLPSLVQVQSAGRPFLISIHDYNRMCLLRREKIVREQMMKNNSGSSQSKQLKVKPW